MWGQREEVGENILGLFKLYTCMHIPMFTHITIFILEKVRPGLALGPKVDEVCNASWFWGEFFTLF